MLQSIGMLDDSYLYKKDFDEHLKKLQKQDLGKLYKKLYENGRLSLNDDVDTERLNDFLLNYNDNLELIATLVRDNYNLQLRVHELGIKNRIKQKVGRYVPPADIKYHVSQTEMEEILSGGFISKNYLPLMSFGNEAQRLFNVISEDSFEEGIKKIQKQISSPTIKNQPLVSIIIPTRDGLHHLKRLFANFRETIKPYSNYEIIVVDNASTDGTHEYLNKIQEKQPLTLISNSVNKSFSESNNIAVKTAKGNFLLFLNNDVLPTSGWLNHMMNTALKSKSIGAVGAKLVYPYKEGFEDSYNIQHGGLGFKLEDDFIRPVNTASGKGFFAVNTTKEEEKAGVTAACLLVEKSKFNEVDGFNEKYWYGYEDVDLCLKLLEKGYKNIINNASVLFHYEFGTQKTIEENVLSSNRKKNIEIFKNQWQKKLYPKYWDSLLNDDKGYTDKKLHIGFIVTEASKTTAAGDYFTAKELGSALEDKGYKVSYIGVKSSHDPYDIDSDIDILISMLDEYDISRINSSKAIKVAWCRNWFDRWSQHSYIRDFDIVLTSSEKAQDLFKEKYIDSYIFNIAANEKRFTKEYSKEEISDFESDICFTGNYWNVPRDISSVLDFDKFKDRFNIKIFGKNWDKVKQMEPFWQGFLEYKNIPKVYAASKILVDDAIFTTNKWGSVNSRVFDGAISGVLVLTNGLEGNKSTFNGLLPTYSSKEELSELIEKYLHNDDLREKKIKEIKEFALKNHTYEHRANELLNILKIELTKKRINIKLPIPNWDEAKQWGDLHFGNAIKKELEKNGYNAKIQILKEWDKPNFGFCNLLIRGLSVFKPPSDQLNIIWNISHPEKVPIDEFNKYDYVFVASNKFSKELTRKGVKNVHTLYQCYDEEFSHCDGEDSDEKYKSDILFVGNTRNEYRKAVKYALSWDKINKYNFKVYGKGWNKFISKKYWAGEHIPNNELCRYYKNTNILLNDHWDDMNEHGFASNRIFDASSVGAFIISDKNSGIDDIFGENVIMQFDNEKSLHELLDSYLKNPKSRIKTADSAQKIIQENHTFSVRIKYFLSIVKDLK